MTEHTSRLKNWHQKFVVEERYVPRVVRRRLYAAAGILMGVGLALFLSILFQVIARNGIVHVDQVVNTWFEQHRSGYVTPFMISLAIGFGPIMLPIILAIAIIIWIWRAKHAWRPLVLAGFMILGVIIVELIAHSVGRMRPPTDFMLLEVDHTFSFPSGHVMATADFFLICSYLIVSRRPTRRLITLCASVSAAIILLQIISRMYLGYHWMSDTFASVSLALFMLGLVMAVDTWRTVRVRGEKIEGEFSQPQVHGT